VNHKISAVDQTPLGVEQQVFDGVPAHDQQSHDTAKAPESIASGTPVFPQ
jgi:hypothetical protein